MCQLETLPILASGHRVGLELSPTTIKRVVFFIFLFHDWSWPLYSSSRHWDGQPSAIEHGCLTVSPRNAGSVWLASVNPLWLVNPLRQLLGLNWGKSRYERVSGFTLELSPGNIYGTYRVKFGVNTDCFPSARTASIIDICHHESLGIDCTNRGWSGIYRCHWYSQPRASLPLHLP